MTPTQTNARLVAMIWFGLAAWQSLRGLAACQHVSRAVTVYWVLHLSLLIAPLLAVWLTAQDDQATGSRSFDPSMALALLTYVPISIAMRLVETCVTAP